MRSLHAIAPPGAACLRRVESFSGPSGRDDTREQCRSTVCFFYMFQRIRSALFALGTASTLFSLLMIGLFRLVCTILAGRTR